MSIYYIVDVGGYLMAKLLINFFSTASHVYNNVLPLIYCATLILIILTKVSQPEIPKYHGCSPYCL